MIERHGWTPHKWDKLTEGEKAIVIASLEYHNEERQREAERRSGKPDSYTKKVI